MDFEAGVRAIAANPRPVVLLCACADPSTCHRTAAARLLAERGFTVTELREAAHPHNHPPPPRSVCCDRVTVRQNPPLNACFGLKDAAVYCSWRCARSSTTSTSSGELKADANVGHCLVFTQATLDTFLKNRRPPGPRQALLPIVHVRMRRTRLCRHPARSPEELLRQ